MRFRFFIFIATCGKNSIIGSLTLYDIEMIRPEDRKAQQSEMELRTFRRKHTLR